MEKEVVPKQTAMASRKDYDFTAVPMRFFASFFAKWLATLGVTPNQITLFNFLVLTPVISYFFIRGGYLENLIAFGFIFVYMIFDLCDGMVARLRSLQSGFGQTLDSSLDRIFQGVLFISVICGVVLTSANWRWAIPGMLLLFGQGMANCMGLEFEKRFGFDGYSGLPTFNEKFKLGGVVTLVDKFLKNIIVPHNFWYILIFTCRYQFFLGILFDQLGIFLIVFAIAINIRWIVLYLLLMRYLYGGKSKLRSLTFLKELEYEKRS
ncbi:MAG: CDP-alcohol phosphatidyltransferase family protein [Candidatus Falkowbacteria bacterium]